jgi:hypothetical protein
VTAGAIEVPGRFVTAACLFSAPSDDPTEQTIALPTGTVLEPLARRGTWTRVSTMLGDARVTGWIPDGVLRTEAMPGDISFMQVAADARLGSILARAGAPVVVRHLACGGVARCSNSNHRAWIESAGGWIGVYFDPNGVQLAEDPEARAARWLTPNRCWTSDELTIPPPTTVGRLSRASIRRTIRSRLGDVRACYEARLVWRPELEGRLRTSFIIAPTGRVRFAATRGMSDPYVRSCVEGVVRTFRFDRPEGGGEVGVNYPFVFSYIE